MSETVPGEDVVQADAGADRGQRPRTQAERTRSTRGALVGAARRLFGERGYADVGTEEIVREAGVTRGALYHHFGGKRELLEAVYEDVEADLTQRIGEAVADLEATSPMAAMQEGVGMFIDATAEPEVQRIVLLDAPAVLGWERWREIAANYGLGMIESILAAAIEAGEIEPQPIPALAHVLMGALDEAAMLVARSDDPEMRAQVTSVLRNLLASLTAGRP